MLGVRRTLSGVSRTVTPSIRTLSPTLTSGKVLHPFAHTGVSHPSRKSTSTTTGTGDRSRRSDRGPVGSWGFRWAPESVTLCGRVRGGPVVPRVPVAPETRGSRATFVTGGETLNF